MIVEAGGISFSRRIRWELHRKIVNLVLKKTWFSVTFLNIWINEIWNKTRIWVRFSRNFQIYVYESCRKKLSPKLVIWTFRDESDGNYREKLRVEFWKKHGFRIFFEILGYHIFGEFPPNGEQIVETTRLLYESGSFLSD